MSCFGPPSMIWSLGFPSLQRCKGYMATSSFLLVKEDLRCTFVNYFMYERSSEYNHRRSCYDVHLLYYLDGYLTIQMGCHLKERNILFFILLLVSSNCKNRLLLKYSSNLKILPLSAFDQQIYIIFFSIYCS